MDEVDRSQNAIYALIDEGVAKVRREAESHLPSTGFCYWCSSTILDGRVFCSRECNDDFQRDKDGRVRNGYK